MIAVHREVRVLNIGLEAAQHEEVVRRQVLPIGCQTWVRLELRWIADRDPWTRAIVVHVPGERALNCLSVPVVVPVQLDHVHHIAVPSDVRLDVNVRRVRVRSPMPVEVQIDTVVRRVRRQDDLGWCEVCHQ